MVLFGRTVRWCLACFENSLDTTIIFVTSTLTIVEPGNGTDRLSEDIELFLISTLIDQNEFARFGTL